MLTSSVSSSTVSLAYAGLAASRYSEGARASANDSPPLANADSDAASATEVTLSPAGIAAQRKDGKGVPEEGAEQTGSGTKGHEASGSAAGNMLTPDELKLIASLRQRDREVRQHEAAHMSAGAGIITSGASYSYERGPDGQRYAVGGEVGIDTSAEKTPAETIAKAQKIRAAALAPAEPSGQDMKVAAHATKMEAQAVMELAALAIQGATSTDTATKTAEADKPTEKVSQRSYAAYGFFARAEASGRHVNIYA